MTAPTLPGSIPGLLRRGSPVVYRDAARVVLSMEWPGVWLDGLDTAEPSEVALDLSDATGRAHAAWFVVGKTSPETLDACAVTPMEWRTVREGAVYGLPMSPASIDALRRVCLHVAGVAP